MSLRTKLVISFTVLLLAVIAAVGFAATRSVRAILVAQIDQTLEELGDRGPGPIQPAPPGERWGDDELNFRRFAVISIPAGSSTGGLIRSGFTDNPDPAPVLDGVSLEPGLVYLPSNDGSLEYRAYIDRLPDGMTVIYAAPLRDVSTATSELIRTLLLAGGGVLLLGGVATWWTVRGATRPVDEMVETAEAIAGGDLTRRVPEPDPATELGRLGGSLNEMLANIEHAVAVERDGRERLRQFVADASHELRTPLAAVSGYAELRRKGGLPTPEDEDRAWTRIESESRRMARLVEDLLMLARLGQSQPLRTGEVDLTRIVHDAAADHRAIDPQRPIEVHAPAGVLLEGDGERLHQVVSNLLSNVRVHAPPGTRVEVSVAERAGLVELAVADDGPGIAEQALEHVFDRFYRADRSRSRRSGGSGLGLAIVEAIVVAHGGTVAAGNVAGRGARVTVALPRHAAGRARPLSPS
jgi:two-component system OmpR family sensor kinase